VEVTSDLLYHGLFRDKKIGAIRVGKRPDAAQRISIVCEITAARFRGANIRDVYNAYR
jgi:hypothetical protein